MSEKINLIDRSDINYRYVLVGILILALLLRLIGLNKSIWLDDYASIYMFSQPTIEKTLQELRTDTHPPLYFVLLHFWSKFSNSEAWLRLPSIFFSTGTVLIVMKWLQPYSRLASILAGLFFATSPILLRYSHDIRGYSLLIFVTALSFFFASVASEKPDKNFGYVGLALSLIAAVSTHMIGIMLILPIFVFMFFRSILAKTKMHWAKTIAAIFIPIFLFSFFYLFYLDSNNAVSKISWLPSISFDSISFVTNYVVGGYTTLYYPLIFDNFITFSIFAFLAIVIILGNIKSNFPLLISAIIYWLQIIIYSIFKNKILWHTTALPILVPLIAFTGLQLATVSKSYLRRGLIIGFTILIIFFTGTWTILEANKPLEEYKTIAQLMKEQWRANNLMCIYPNYIKNTIKYYWHDLPLQSLIALEPNQNIEKLSSELNSHKNTKTIIMTIRVDLTIQKEIENYQKVLSLISSKLAKPLTIKTFFIISNGFKKIDGDSKTLSKLLAIQESKFGVAKFYQDFDSYIVAKYELN